jgi:hypothetical protein
LENFWTGLSSGGSNTLLVISSAPASPALSKHYKHLSSTTLITDRRPFCENLGVGSPTIEPSPRKNGESSDLVSCAASRIVKGRTRTATEMDEAPSGTAIVVAIPGWELPVWAGSSVEWIKKLSRAGKE